MIKGNEFNDSALSCFEEERTSVASFGILSVKDMFNEHRPVGFNSSIMIWFNKMDKNGKNAYEYIFTLLEEYGEDFILKYINKFDHWLEMVLPINNVYFIQERFPQHIVEYRSHALRSHTQGKHTQEGHPC